jgi:hypothetical protein
MREVMMLDAFVDQRVVLHTMTEVKVKKGTTAHCLPSIPSKSWQESQSVLAVVLLNFFLPSSSLTQVTIRITTAQDT